MKVIIVSERSDDVNSQVQNETRSRDEKSDENEKKVIADGEDREFYLESPENQDLTIYEEDQAIRMPARSDFLMNDTTADMIIDELGRIQIPDHLLRKVGWKPFDTVRARIEDSEFLVIGKRIQLSEFLEKVKQLFHQDD